MEIIVFEYKLFKITRINLDNTLDTTFNLNTELNGLVKDIYSTSTVRIIVCRKFSTFNNTPSKYVNQLSHDGTKLNTSFNIEH